MNDINVNRFFYYDELSSEAKEQARQNVLLPEYEERERNIKKAYREYLANPNEAINDPYHIRRLINGGEALRKVKQYGNDYLIRFIRSNHTIFTDKGDYVYYSSGCVEVITECNRLRLDNDEVKQLANKAYCEVNDRGPSYHDNLYRTWHRIKHLMIR